MIQDIIAIIFCGVPVVAFIIGIVTSDRYRSNEEELLDWHYWAKDGWT